MKKLLQGLYVLKCLKSVFSTFHMGPQETNLVFDIWTGNSSEQGRHSPVHNIFAEKYKPRTKFGNEAYQVNSNSLINFIL